jgi:S-adenosylmethionine:tRNA ribosyltransferase-isomerase
MTNKDLILDSYDYELSPDNIAHSSREQRSKSRVLIYNEQNDEVFFDYFINLGQYLQSSDQLVFNQSKVFPCRLNAFKESGGKVEVFLLSASPLSENIYPAFLKTNRTKKLGDKYKLENCETLIEIVELGEDGVFYLNFGTLNVPEYFYQHGKTPLPPYIKSTEQEDVSRDFYQTLYAKDAGSVAAPTAGLHFDEDLFQKLQAKGIKSNFVTLHVGAGTFRPVSAENILEHKMHEESFFVDQSTAENINAAKKLIAVGTTSLRVLESIYDGEKFSATKDFQNTDIFLHPGVDVKSIDGLITNFHLPKSSLLMLVSSLIGREKTLALYELAKKQNFKFYSYGDGMLILRKRYFC